MKCNALSVLLIIISPVVWGADDYDTRVELGNPTLSFSQPLNREFAQKTFTQPALCERDCSDVAVKWTSLAPLLNTSTPDRGIYRFESGIKGIEIQINTQTSGTQLSAGQPVSFQVGLVRASRDVAVGTMPLSKPLLKWSLLSKKKSGLSSVPEKEGTITVRGGLTVSGCELKTDSLDFNLASVNINDLKKTTPGKPFTGIRDSQSIVVDCIPGAFSSLHAVFKAGNIMSGNPTIINTDENDTGVGFIVLGGEGSNQRPVSWNETGEPLTLNVPPDGHFSYPLTAFYTRTSDTVKAGSINAHAQFTISYP